MRKLGAIAVLTLAGLALGVAAVWAAEASTASSTTPPKHLKKVGEHWTPWDPPAPGPDSYIILKGDTLWDLSGKWLGNPHLWPQIWDQNRYVLDSHWIYPGDPLGVPGKPTVVPPEGPPPGPEHPATTPGEPAPRPSAPSAAKPAPLPAPLLPIADAADVYCSGVIDPAHQASPVRIIGRETEREHVAQGDVVYLSRGRGQGVAAGNEFAVLRASRTAVIHPATGAPLGLYVRRLGKVRVLAAQENTSTAVIVDSCTDMAESDEVVPWSEIPIPRMASLPKLDRWNAEPSGGPLGYVVATRDDIGAIGNGHVMFTDLGTSQGIQPGSVLRVFREPEGLPRLILGQAVVLEAREGNSTAKVTQSVKEIGVGDRVELER